MDETTTDIGIFEHAGDEPQDFIINNEGNVVLAPGMGNFVNRTRNIGGGREEFRVHPLDFEIDVSLGIDLPMQTSKGSLFQLNYLSIDQAVANLKNLVLTMKGERLYHPNFGTNIRRALFEPNTAKLRSFINDELKQAVAFWLPYIVIDETVVKIPEGKGSSPSFADNYHGIQITLVISLKNNRIDKRTIVLDIRAD